MAGKPQCNGLRLLADADRYVIRYDNRDTGESSASPLGHPSYTGEDLTQDPLRVIGGLGVVAAHLVGVSMGGGIAQSLAVREPARAGGSYLFGTLLIAFSLVRDARFAYPILLGVGFSMISSIA